MQYRRLLLLSLSLLILIAVVIVITFSTGPRARVRAGNVHNERNFLLTMTPSPARTLSPLEFAATAIASDLTATAQASGMSPLEVAATAITSDLTATAAAVGDATLPPVSSPTRAPVLATPTPTPFRPTAVPTESALLTLDPFELTATHIIAQATAQAEGGTATALPELDPTLSAGVTGDFALDPIFGPDSGSLIHNAQDAFITTFNADIAIENFIVEVTFLNPYNVDTVGWSHGILFRDNEQGQYRVIFDSAGNWELTLVLGDEFRDIQTGILSNVLDKKSERNSIRLAVDGDTGAFNFNGELIAQLDLSEHSGLGDVAIGTGMYEFTEIDGANTPFEDLTIYPIGELPELTPTPTPIAASDAAAIGTQRGEIEVGGGETWAFEGEEGMIVTIRVLADRPAGRQADNEERLERNLFDTYLYVYGPDGELIAENDDNEDLPDEDVEKTNSSVTITLPVTGTYTIEVRSWDDRSGGRYTLEIIEVRQLGSAEFTPTPRP